MITLQKAETEITKMVSDLATNMGLNSNVNGDFCPGGYVASTILITIMSRLERVLDIKIPNTTYIFHDKKIHKHLSIKEAAQKLIKEAVNGK